MTTPTNPPSLYDLLNKRFSQPAYALFYEVRNRTGYSHGGRERYADALALSLWPSRGLDLYGFEVKHARSDWLRELNDPEKAEAIAQYCDYWFVVVPNDDIVKVDELPKAWGLLVARGAKLVTVKDAPKRKAKPWTRAFVASLLRNAHEHVMRHIARSTPNDQVEAKIEAEVEKRVAKREGSALADATRDVQSELNQLRRRNEIFERIEAATGVPLIQEWRWSKIATALERIGSMDAGAAAQSVKWAVDRLENALAEARGAYREAMAASQGPDKPDQT